MTDELICVHCGEAISTPEFGVHTAGSNTGLQRCGVESGLPYGYNAHGFGTACRWPCIGDPDA